MSSPRLAQLQQFLADSPNDPFILFAIAKEYESLGDLSTARSEFEKLQANHPSYVGLYYHLAKIYELMTEPTLAWKTYTKGLEVAQKAGDQHAYNELAGARLNLGDEEDFEE